MKRTTTHARTRTAFALAPAVLLLAVGPVLAAGPALAGSLALGADNVVVSNSETVQARLKADGTVESARVYEQIALQGNGSVVIANPVSTENLRNLDGFNAFVVKDGKMISTQSVNGEARLRSVSDYDKQLPLNVSVTYKLDGVTVKAGDVVGKTGRLDVHYKVENVTGKNQDVTYNDGTGQLITSTQKVVIPMVGTLATVLPSNFVDVASKEANMAGDGRGQTKMSFTMTLFGPIGSPTSEFGYSARITAGVIPDATITALPVSPLDSPSFKGAAASYKGGAATGTELTAGATEINANVLKLRDGSATLLAGLIQLGDGATKLNTGLAGDAAPGANKLAAGATKLNDGAGQLAAGAGTLYVGAGELSSGLNTAATAAPALLDGLTQVSGGLEKVDAGLVLLYGGIGGLPAKAQPLHDGITKLLAGLGSKTASGTLIYGVEAVRQGLATQAVPGLQTAIDGLYSTSPSAPGAYQKLDCAQKILTDVVNGTLANSTAGKANPCYYDATTNPSALTPVLKGLTDTPDYPAPGMTELSKSVTAGVQAKLLASLPDLANPASPTTPSTSNLVGGLYKIKAGLDTHAPGTYGPTDPGGAGYALTRVECGMDSQSFGSTSASPCYSATDVDPSTPGVQHFVPGLVQGLGLVDAGVSELVSGVVTEVQGAVGHSADVAPAQNTLRGGVHAVMGGVDLIGAGGVTLLDGLNQLNAGASQLDAGAGKLSSGATTLADGTTQLSDGANTLATGLGDAAAGSGLLAAGLTKASDGAQALPAGAEKLSVEGTSKLVDAGISTASDYGLKYATIVAGADRAKTEAMAYGAPLNAAGTTAYSLEISGASTDPGASMARGLGALVLFGLGVGLILFRRRTV